MIEFSDLYKSDILDGRATFIRKGTIAFADGTSISFDDSNIWSGGFKIDEATTDIGSFDVGATVSSQLTLILYNEDNKYSSYDFSGAVITAYVGMTLSDETEEVHQRGVYTVQKPTFSSDGMLITLVAYDNISKLSKTYSAFLASDYAHDKKYGTTDDIYIYDLIYNMLDFCGISYDMSTFFDGISSLVGVEGILAPLVPEKISYSETTTCRDMISYAAQMLGFFARCTVSGGLEFAWYKKPVQTGGETVASLDGGNLTDYTSGDTADGGDYTFSETDNYTGGTFDYSESAPTGDNFHTILHTFSSEVGTDPITITGFLALKQNTTSTGSKTTTRVFTDNEIVTENTYTVETEPGYKTVTTQYLDADGDIVKEVVVYTYPIKTTETCLYGKEGYVVDITQNPIFIEVARAEIEDYAEAGLSTVYEICTFLSKQIIALLIPLRSFSITALGDPSMQAGDTFCLVLPSGNYYYGYITTLSYTVGNSISISCDVKDSEEQSADTTTESGTTVVDPDATQEQSEFDTFLQQLKSLVSILETETGYGIRVNGDASEENVLAVSWKLHAEQGIVNDKPKYSQVISCDNATLASGTSYSQVGELSSVPDDGYSYGIDVTLAFSANATGYRGAAIYYSDDGGTTKKEVGWISNDIRAAVDGHWTTCKVSLRCKMPEGRTLYIYAMQNSGSDRTVVIRYSYQRIV